MFHFKITTMVIAALPITERNRSLVVLAGWLGSQPKSLRRYESLYRKLGIPLVLTRIAPPFSVVQAVLQPLPVQPIQVPNEWPNKYNNVTAVQDLAWNILKDIHEEKSCDRFYMHVFSNAGCFVWEQIRQILQMTPYTGNTNDKPNKTTNEGTYTDTPLLSQDVVHILSTLRRKLAGVVFDSCPIADLHRLPDALQYCSWTERLNVIRYCGFEHMFIQSDPKLNERVRIRIKSYVSGLKTDPLRIPQLYLYARDDPLAPASFIDEIVNYRKARIGIDQITHCCWDESLHCCHLLKHPQDYSNAVENYLKQGNANTYRSKL
jgi:Eukaryotic protein of unknown function (DUF829)